MIHELIDFWPAYSTFVFPTASPRHFHMDISEAHTHNHTCIISTQEELRQPDKGAGLKEAEERLLLETKALHTHTKNNCQKKPIYTNLKKRIRAHRAKLLEQSSRLFLMK